MLKFKYKGMMEVEQMPENPDVFVITKLDHSLVLWQHIDLKTLSDDKKFTPIYGDSLALVDPKRTERLCPPIIDDPNSKRK